jgi:sarcosine oxidase, subunit gamma
MASGITRRSPLEALAGDLAAASTAELSIREVPFAVQIDLRGNSHSGEFPAAAYGILGGDLPLAPNTFTRMSSLDALWLGPDQWLLVSFGNAATSGLEAGLRRALAGQHASIVDVSDCRAVLDLSGPQSRQVLLQGLSLDLHPRTFGPGQCAQTLLARAPIILQQLTDAPSYRIFVARSFSHYMVKWLCDAMRTFLLEGEGGPGTRSRLQ